MILHDLHVRGPCLRPTKADPVALVDPDAVLSLPMNDQSFKPVSWWHAQVIEPFNGIELVELPSRYPPQVAGARPPGCFRVAPVEHVFRARVGEGPDQGSTIARVSCYHNWGRLTWR